MNFKSILKKVNSNIKPNYLKALDLPVDENLVLLEGGQGSNINGNMFAMLKEIKTNPKYSEYTCVYVVTEGNIEKAKARMSFYGFSNVILSVRDSKSYCKYLATAKYLLTDNSFPPYFSKRDEQVYLNTWHGTPLKTLGMSDKSNLASLANIQKNFLMSDFALFPNQFTKDVFFYDYDLKYTFGGKSLVSNYPRNSVFYDTQQGIDMKFKLGYYGKTVFAYMPTWRGTGRTANTSEQLKITKRILDEFDSKLNDDQILLVNLHFLLASNIDCNDYKHIEYFPSDYETYEVLNACDGLITDYSSVFFDYAITRKNIILFAYDKEEYLETRGIYIPFERLPFPIVETVDDVVSQMSKPAKVSEGFIKAFCPNGSKLTCEKIFDLMINGESFSLETTENEDENKELCLMYVGSISPYHFDSIKEYIRQNPEYNYVLAYRKNFREDSKEFLSSLGKNVTAFGTVTAMLFSLKEAFLIILNKLFGAGINSKAMQDFLTREASRMFYGIKPKRVVDFACDNLLISGMLSKLMGERFYINHGIHYGVTPKKEKAINKTIFYENSKGFSMVDMSAIEEKAYADNPIDKDEEFDPSSSMTNIAPLYFTTGKRLRCLSLFSFKSGVPTRLKDCQLLVGDRVMKPFVIANRKKLSKKHFGVYSFYISAKDIDNMPPKNSVCIQFTNKYGVVKKTHAFYNSFFWKRTFGLRSPILHNKNTDTVAIFRQMIGNRLDVYIRSYIKSDNIVEHLKQNIAFFAAKLWRGKGTKNIILLFEKDSAKYEESASVTYEKLIDEGYDNAYFILDKTSPYCSNVPEKYKKNIIDKYSFKHYLYFFKAQTFIGTEQMVHAIELKTFNPFALMKIASRNVNYVFLQHGVMYMVSLNSESRRMFERKALNGKYRVVVSSNLEKQHFTELGGHESEDVYVCGLPKYDRNVLLPEADKIVIMPTWHPWELNQARADFLSTPYFKMTMKIYQSVPDELKEKVIILPHPLVASELKNLPKDVSDKIVLNAKYDDILKETRLLITDYSSIAYDAFYRGSNVIFYWEEKDYCMEQYGPSTRLMLNEENTFGDYFYSTEGLQEGIKESYENPQREEYVERYSRIVEFHDGKNTDRLISFLKEDKII